MNTVKKPYLVGITGGSGSGKTFFLNKLGAIFNQTELCILSQDNYYKTAHHHVKDENGQINYDLPSCIDLDAFHKDILKLYNNQIVRRREYRFQHEEQYGEWMEIYPAPIILVEGLFIFYKEEIFKHFDFKLFIEASEEIQLQRRIRRDIEERNIPEDFVMYQWKNHVMPAFKTYLFPYKEKADLVINNNEHVATSLKVIEDHLKARLQERL